ncbi:hypothetical protein EVAR_14402_1 [Eumeta japonica]|uniref:Uncharacterized protein n=1 Tax=Eumeta variegata TaxID=151549 RepID=A0A4C1TX72_EUMVA|nr:hypothetical protein EVAR_14402_1 [Eumeta japonica]
MVQWEAILWPISHIMFIQGHRYLTMKMNDTRKVTLISLFVYYRAMLWSTGYNTKIMACSLRCHTLTEYRCKVTAFTVAVRPITESLCCRLPLHHLTPTSIGPLAAPTDILFLPKRLAVHW